MVLLPPPSPRTPTPQRTVSLVLGTPPALPAARPAPPSSARAGYRVKNLRGTSGCPHYRKHKASADSGTKCAVNGCAAAATRACHVVSANQNGLSGRRKLVYMCPSHNGLHERVFRIRRNARTCPLPHCSCGWVL